jgi:phosphate butyryltransferase
LKAKPQSDKALRRETTDYDITQTEVVMIKSFRELEARAKKQPSKRVALAMAQEADALNAVLRAQNEDIVRPVLVGDPGAIESVAKSEKLDISSCHIVAAESDAESAALAVKLVREGEADLLMKGKVATATLMKAVLDKERGLRGAGVLSHVTIAEIKSYPKLLFMSDPALNIAPDLDAKIAILNNAVEAARRLGVETPKVGVICAVEKVNPEAMPATRDAALLAKMADRGQIANCLIDGPFALDNAVSSKSCQVKGIRTEVGGDADILLMPDIEAANVFYKTLAYLTDNPMAGIIMGAKVPIILTSRADSDRIKYLSILAGVSLV